MRRRENRVFQSFQSTQPEDLKYDIIMGETAKEPSRTGAKPPLKSAFIVITTTNSTTMWKTVHYVDDDNFSFLFFFSFARAEFATHGKYSC